MTAAGLSSSTGRPDSKPRLAEGPAKGSTEGAGEGVDRGVDEGGREREPEGDDGRKTGDFLPKNRG